MGLFRSRRSWLLVLLALLLGAMAGTVVAEALRDTIPPLMAYRSVGFDLHTLDLAGFLRFHLGLHVNLSVGAIAGMVLAAVLVRRL